MAPRRASVAWPILGLTAVGFAAALIAFAGRYGYHRDELYFLAIGAHPAFGYIDQPPLVPLLDHGLDLVSGHSLVALRLAPALAGAFTVLITGLLAREFGASRAAQALAAVSMAVSAILVDAAHIASTTAMDLLFWTLVIWLVVIALRDDGRMWLLAGLVAGVALEVKSLLLFLFFALFVGIVTAGPRRALRSRWLWTGGAIAVAVWSPNLIWQAVHGWPQLALSTAIATGGSGTSQPRWLFVPYQAVLVSPVLIPLWVAGWWRLARDPGLRTWRSIAIAFPVLAVLFIAIGGKPYYLCGMYPVLLAAGAEPTFTWLNRGVVALKRILLSAALVISAFVSALLMLPLISVDDLHSTPIPSINYDAGETVGWPMFTDRLVAAYDELTPAERSGAVVIGANYGEAGALTRYRPELPIYGAQNSFWGLGTPPATTETAIVVGYTDQQLRVWFGDIRRVAFIDNEIDLDNDEQGKIVWRCAMPKLAWPTIWQQMKRVG